MPPKTDPYATSRARVADVALVLLVIVIILLTIFTAPRRHTSDGPRFNPPAAKKNSVLLASGADR